MTLKRTPSEMLVAAAILRKLGETSVTLSQADYQDLSHVYMSCVAQPDGSITFIAQAPSDPAQGRLPLDAVDTEEAADFASSYGYAYLRSRAPREKREPSFSPVEAASLHAYRPGCGCFLCRNRPERVPPVDPTTCPCLACRWAAHKAGAGGSEWTPSGGSSGSKK